MQALGLSGSGRRAVKRSPMELPPMRVLLGLFKEVDVLGSTNAAATIAVKDIAVAREFYEDKLGLELSGTEGESVRSYRSGSSTILVYESRFAGTNQATAATWLVGDALDAIVRALTAKGVAFEHYDFPERPGRATCTSRGIPGSPGSRTPTATSCRSSMDREIAYA